MATIKSYTDLEQSKKLAEILPLDSADGGWYGTTNLLAANTHLRLGTKYNESAVCPAWSLAALLGVLPQGEYKDIDLCYGGYTENKYIPEWFCSYEQQEPSIIEICHTDNPIDACYDMIIRLHELNLL